jgi:ribosomal protein S18 acetylase RimI-like enzyme
VLNECGVKVINVKVIAKDDDLRKLVKEINCAVWDDANEMSEYDAEALAEYLDCQDTIFLACYEVVEGVETLVGIASSRLETKPYGRERWLYVDEVDVCADQRRKGAGKTMMKKFLAIAEAAECEEVWLGTEVDNRAANALYRSLNPDDVAQVVGYTYEMAD